MSAETITQEVLDLDAHQAVRQNLPMECQGCSFAEKQIDQLGWTVALGRLTSERAAELVIERTGCYVGATVTRLVSRAVEIG